MSAAAALLAGVAYLSSGAFPGAGYAGAGLAVLAVAGNVLLLHRLTGLEVALRRIAHTATAAAKGDLEVRLLEPPAPGPVGETESSVNLLLDISDAFVREARGATQAFASGRYYRKVLTRGLPGHFGRAAEALNAAMADSEAKQRDFVQFARENVEAVADTVSSAAVRLHENAERMTATAETLARQAGNAAREAEAGSSGAATIAAAAEELSISGSEIGRQVAQAAGLAQHAVQTAGEADGTIRRLVEAARKVGEILGLINAIAGRTNLLALNATVEAARAGELGKGFGVVAAEVKSLARQTEQATGEIAAQVAAIRTITDSTVQAIAGIGEAIGQIGTTTTAIAAAVEEQGAATQEIARSIQRAAHGTQAIAATVATVTEASGEAGGTARQVLSESSDLEQNSGRLRQEVGVFLRRLGNL